MLSSRARYATRAILDLCMRENEGPILVQDISDRQSIPLKFLQQILIDLKQAGFVQSRKGPGGGYLLSQKPESITLGQVLRAMDGPVIDLSCNVTTQFNECGCPNPAVCALRVSFVELADAMSEVLERTTFAQLRDRQITAEQNSASVLDFVI